MTNPEESIMATTLHSTQSLFVSRSVITFFNLLFKWKNVMTDRDTNNDSVMRKLLIALSVCVVLAACNHMSGEGGPTTTEPDMDIGNGNGGGY